MMVMGEWRNFIRAVGRCKTTVELILVILILGESPSSPTIMKIYESLKRTDFGGRHVVLDLGANAGIETKKLLSTFPNSIAIAVEPVISNIGIMAEEIAKEECQSRWFLEHCAVANKYGVAEFKYESSKGMAGRANGSLDDFNWRAWQYNYTSVVRTKTVEQIAPDATIAKLDLERYEYEVLPSVLALPRIQAIFVELHGPCYEFNVKNWLDNLTSGFEVTWYDCTQHQNGEEDDYQVIEPKETIDCGWWSHVVIERK